jgi:cysteinyl-tRNA synthetase
LVVFDSVKKEKLEFSPISGKDVKIYVCGPTVYDNAHLGHARSSISFDLLRRVLSELGFNVTFMKNFTDIDDKIIKKSIESGRSFEDVANEYTQNYLDDMEALNVAKADIEPKATESLSSMISMISKLINSDFAYKSDNGDIYFDVAKFDSYGAFSNMVEDESQVKARVKSLTNKRSEKDFVLWKAKTDNDKIFFHSPFGDGRPGWHIECSAMIEEYLAYKDGDYAIDIHAGGADLIFPHHENEVAQTKCATNKNLAKYWMHNGFVNIDGQKMSKSLGNSFFIKDALKVYSGEVLRFYLMSVHYRANFNFNEQDLLSSKKRLDKLYRLKKRLYGMSNKNIEPNIKFKDSLLDALGDDLNISKSLAIVDEMVSNSNDTMNKEPKNKIIKRETLGNIELINRVLGIGLIDAFEYFQDGVSNSDREVIIDLILKRDMAKKDRDYTQADAIREELKAMNISIMDTANGTMWERIY